MHQNLLVKKLVAVTTTFILMTDVNKNASQSIRNFDQISSIYYPVLFSKNIAKRDIMTFIDSRSKVIAINFVYAAY